jgi:hypothetical protein
MSDDNSNDALPNKSATAFCDQVHFLNFLYTMYNKMTNNYKEYIQSKFFISYFDFFCPIIYSYQKQTKGQMLPLITHINDRNEKK